MRDNYTVVTTSADELVSEWDERKSRTNRDRHRVPFEEARSAFLDENARVIVASGHSDGEETVVLLGFSAASRILVVCHFRNLAEENGIPCQNLINLYLRDCVESDRKLNTKWE